MSEKLFKALEKAPNAETANGANTYDSSNNSFLDFFYEAGNARTKDEQDIYTLVENSKVCDKENTIRLIGYMRDVRNGLGERKGFRLAMKYLIANGLNVKPKKLFDWCMEYGRADDYYEIVCSAYKGEELKTFTEVIKKALAKDVKAKAPTLLAKWLPSVNASSKETRDKARVLCKCLEMTEKDYRKTLAGIRKKIKLIETFLTNKDYSFEYSSIPSLAMLKYKNAFMRNDYGRYNEYLEAVNSGDEKMNMAVAEPRAIYRMWQGGCANYDLVEAAWKSLRQQDLTDVKFLPVLDTSASMWGTPSEIGASLAVYFSERLPQPYKDKVISFSRKARYFDLSKFCTVSKKFDYLYGNSIVEDTNVESVLHLMFKTARDNGLTDDDIPTLLFLSDMQFNRGLDNINGCSYHDAFKKIADIYGYKLPRIVYWNINAHEYKNSPVRYDEQGVVMLSGSSTNAIQALYHINETPLETALATVQNSKAGNDLLEVFKKK
nr:MAG TPA: protein of unknown function (DUF2828) [Caudoviricetes sp.]